MNKQLTLIIMLSDDCAKNSHRAWWCCDSPSTWCVIRISVYVKPRWLDCSGGCC